MIDHIRDIFHKYLAMVADEWERVGSGRNGKVYRISCKNAQTYIIKFYHRNPHDLRDRLGVEFHSLQFLWSHHIRSIPKPLQKIEQEHCAIYEYIHGVSLEGKSTLQDISAFVQFALDLKKLCALASNHIAVASEATFSLQELADVIRKRLSKLLAVEDKELTYFLKQSFEPIFASVLEKATKQLSCCGFSSTYLLPQKFRTLSPSDYGLHNAIRSEEGIKFLDFEYFGWDDPVKMISDFLLHPGMSLTDTQKSIFFQGMLDGFSDHPRLFDRLTALYPFYGLKWVLILLNEFLPENLSRRFFSDGSHVDVEEIKRQQLEKAKKMLMHTDEANEKFPFL